MKTSNVTPEDLLSSVLSLPPLAHDSEGRLNRGANAAISQWLQQGGITTFLYGGIANFFNLAVEDYAETLDLIESLARDQDWIIPSIGPDFGKARAQIEILKGRRFPTALLLPLQQVSASGVATGLRRLSDAFGRPLMAFFKSIDYVTPQDLAALVRDGVLCGIEYGVSGPGDPEPFLAAYLDAAGSAAWLIDGQGERTILGNASYGLRAFTSGLSAIAPHLSSAMFKAICDGRTDDASALQRHFRPLAQLRLDHGPIPVAHDAVRLAGIANTGPLAPFFANCTDPTLLEQIRAAALELKQASLAFDGRASSFIARDLPLVS